MASQPGKQINVIHILPDISRSKGNQVKKLGLLIDYNMRNIFLQKSYTKCGAETSRRPFSEKCKPYLWINWLKFQKVYFYCMPS